MVPLQGFLGEPNKRMLIEHSNSFNRNVLIEHLNRVLIGQTMDVLIGY